MTNYTKNIMKGDIEMKHNTSLNANTNTNSNTNNVTHEVEDAKYLLLLCKEKPNLIIRTEFGLGKYKFVKFTRFPISDGISPVR